MPNTPCRPVSKIGKAGSEPVKTQKESVPKLAKGGRAAFKHGKFVKEPTPHADIAKYVEKDSSKSPKHYRKEGSTLKMGKKSGRRGLSPGATRQAKATGYTGRTPVVEVKREGPRNEKFNVKIKKASGGRIGYRGGGRTNLLEELGRVEGEHSNRNRRAEVSRIHGELNKGYKKGGRSGYSSGGAVLKGKKVGIQIK
jgi:hypothetical protein